MARRFYKEAYEYAPFYIRCDLCGQSYGHDGHLVWRQLRAKRFDDRGQHVVGFDPFPVTDWRTRSALCVGCLAGLGLLSR